MAATTSSHLVLARKWRPQRFDELVGQEHVTRTLTQALRSGRIAHAFLFTGIRGVGKTTAARILARCLNCEQGPTPQPCGTCAACIEIGAGGALDTIEIDGATYRKIDDARAIIENLGYRPARDRFKIYIVDEAHQLTDQAFNALLKTLEEPPAHVKFILATTEPQKMPETILSRLQRYDFRRIPFAIIVERLRQLTAREDASAEDAALNLLAREAGGSMRDAERMLETAIASLDGTVSEAGLAQILGVASRSRVIDLAGAVIEKDPAGALATVRELYRSGADLEALGRDLLEVIRNLAVARLPGAQEAGSVLADLPDQEAAALRGLAEKASLRDLMRLFYLLANGQELLLKSPYPDLILEMTLVRMATLAPVIDADELLRVIGRAEAGVAGAAAPATPAPASETALARTQSAGAASAARETGGSRRIPFRGEVRADLPSGEPRPRVAAVHETAAAAQGIAQDPAQDKTDAAVSADPASGLPDLRDFIRARRAALAGFMEQGAALRMAADTIFVTPRNDIYVRYLNDNRSTIADLASELYGRKIKVELESTAADSASIRDDLNDPRASGSEAASAAASATDPASGRDATSPDRPATIESADAARERARSDVRQALYADPVVRRIFDEFEARLVEVRTAPGEADRPVRARKENDP